jgi:hypothetical protein
MAHVKTIRIPKNKGVLKYTPQGIVFEDIFGKKHTTLIKDASSVSTITDNVASTSHSPPADLVSLYNIVGGFFYN